MIMIIKVQLNFMVEIMRKFIIGSRNMNLRVKMLWKIDAASVNLKNY